MKPKEIRWFVLGYAALLIVAMNLRSDEMIGFGSDWTNGDYSYRVGSAPWALAFSVVGLGIYLLLVWSKVGSYSRPIPQLFRRWVAAMIDFVGALMIPVSYVGLAGILLEYRRTGVFDWLVERQQAEPGDGLYTAVSAVTMFLLIMPAYFAICWWRGRATPGSCIFNFRIVADEGTRLSLWRAYLRAMLGSIALIAWPCWILAYWLRRDQRAGKFWLDVVFKTHADSLG
jgi:uncharacterized RDD family membrane protein YckC